MTPYYDPMIAKIIGFGETRDAARSRLAQVLTDTAVLGVATNLGFLHRVVADADFAAGAVETGFIENRRETLLAPASDMPNLVLAAATLYCLEAQPNLANGFASPWGQASGWRPNLDPMPQTLVFRSGQEELTVDAVARSGGWRLRLRDGEWHTAAALHAAGKLAVTLDGERRTVIVLEHDGVLAVFLHGDNWRFDIIDPLAPPEGADTAAGRLSAPMPGRVVQLLVAAGDPVRRGQPLAVLEAMKMEHTIAAPRDGIVTAVHCAAGDLVEEGTELIALAEPAA